MIYNWEKVKEKKKQAPKSQQILEQQSELCFRA